MAGGTGSGKIMLGTSWCVVAGETSRVGVRYGESWCDLASQASMGAVGMLSSGIADKASPVTQRHGINC